MANENKHWAPVFDADRRKVTNSSLDELENVGVGFNAYGIVKGQLLTIEANPEVVKQEPRVNGQRPTYLVACKRDGQKSWFNPNSLLGIDANMQPIYPKWANLGGAKAVVETIIKMKGIKGGNEFDITLRAFNRDGSIKQEAVRDEKGEIKINAEGLPEMKDATVTRKRVSVPDPVTD